MTFVLVISRLASTPKVSGIVAICVFVHRQEFSLEFLSEIVTGEHGARQSADFKGLKKNIRSFKEKYSVGLIHTQSFVEDYSL